jgi:hypothetical protein
MPKPNENHQKLQQLVGTWIGEETMNPSPWGPGGQATGRYECRIDIDGLFAIQDYVQEKAGKVTYRGHGIFGWDGEKKTFTWYWVDSLGTVPAAPSRGQWVGDTLQFEHEPVGELRGRYTYKFMGLDRYQFSIENSQDGGKTWFTFMVADYRRQ